MFEDENEEEWLSPRFKDKLNKVEEMYLQNAYTYFDSEEVEYLLDHLVLTNQIEKATWLVECALEHFPSNETLGIRYAQILSMNGEHEKALSNLKKIELLEPFNVELLIAIASIYSQQKDNKKAVVYYERAIPLAEEEEEIIEICIDLASEYKISNQIDKAIFVLQKALNRGIENDLLVFEISICYEELGNNDKAIQCLLDYIDDFPYSYTTWFNLGNLYAKLGKIKQAIWAFDYAVIINETFVPALYNIANAYLDNESFQEALSYYHKCLAIDKDDPMVYFSMGECYEELGAFEDAYKYYLKSSRLLPQLADAWLGRGVMNDLMNNHTKAIQELLVAVDLKPDNWEGWRALAHAYENKEQKKQALEAYEKALDVAPDNDEITIEYLSYLAEFSIEEVLLTIKENKNLKNNNICLTVLCYCYWMADNETESKLIFEQIIENDVNLAKNLFTQFPEMNEVEYFVNRLAELDENEDNEKF